MVKTGSTLPPRAALSDRSVTVRAQALTALLGGGEAAVRYVAEVETRLLDPDPGLRRLAVQVLSRAGRGGVSGLIRALSPRQFLAVRIEAANALAEIGPDAEEAIDALCACLFAKAEALRERASWALGRIGAAAVVPLKDLLGRTDDPLARAAACDSLGYVGPPAEPARGELKTQAGTEPEAVRLAAQAALCSVLDGSGKHLKELARQTEHPDAAVRRDALVRIGRQRTRGQEALSRVLERLGDPDPTVRAEAAYVLARIEADPGEHTPALAELLADPDAEVRAAAGAALHAFGPPAEAALPALEARFGDPDDRVAAIARAAVKKIKGDE